MTQEEEKYLSVKLVGHNPINVFLNKEKTKENQPDFKADGIAVWVNQKKPKAEEKQSPL